MSFMGRLRDLPLPEILRMLGASKKTGKLSLTRREGSGMIIFRDGKVIHATSDSVRDTLGNILICQNRLTEEALMAALELQHLSLERKRLGAILIEKGFVSPEAVEEAVRHQLEQVVSELLTWETGFFKFEVTDITIEDAIEVDAEDFLIKTGINAEHLVMEGTRCLDEEHQFEKESPTEGAPRPLTPEPHGQELAEGGRGPDYTKLKPLLRDIQSPSFTGEITLSIMRYASDVVSRGALLFLRKDGIAGFAQFGLDAEGVSGLERVRKIKIPLTEPSVFSEISERRESYRGKIGPSKWNDFFLEQLGGNKPNEAVLVPMVVTGKVVAIFYGDDNGTGRPLGDVDSLEVFIAQVSLTIEKSILEKRLRALGQDHPGPPEFSP